MGALCSRPQLSYSMFSLPGSGQTTILFTLKHGSEQVSHSATVGFAVESITFKRKDITLWDVGGAPAARVKWCVRLRFAAQQPLPTRCPMFLSIVCASFPGTFISPSATDSFSWSTAAIAPRFPRCDDALALAAQTLWCRWLGVSSDRPVVGSRGASQAGERAGRFRPAGPAAARVRHQTGAQLPGRCSVGCEAFALLQCQLLAARSSGALSR